MTSKFTDDEKLKILFDDYLERGVVPSLNEELYDINLKSFQKLKKEKLPYIYDLNHLCSLSNSSTRQIGFFCQTKIKLILHLMYERKMVV